MRSAQEVKESAQRFSLRLGSPQWSLCGSAAAQCGKALPSRAAIPFLLMRLSLMSGT